MGSTSAEPDLYSVDDAGVPTLFGARDSAGNVSFPDQSYGSVFNGDHGALLTRTELSGLGTVTATATVLAAATDGTPSPITVASIVLEEGPLIRAVLDEKTAVTAGDKVEATTVAVTRGDSTLRELRFAVSNPKEGA